MLFLFSITTLICLNGIHRKTWASVISTICILFLIMALFEFSIQFFGDLDYSNLEYLGSMSNSADIFWTDIMLTGLGAIMDVAVTISARNRGNCPEKSRCFSEKINTFRTGNRI
ncbi:YibE/F family protein [Blautia wexlerae]|nr:YibE/F family protein [Blautia wexlerae]